MLVLYNQSWLNSPDTITQTQLLELTIQLIATKANTHQAIRPVPNTTIHF